MDTWADRALSATAERTAAGKLPRHQSEHRGVTRRAEGEAAPYPGELALAVALEDGTKLRLRPIRPDDEPRLAELHARLSEYTAYQRFFTVARKLPSDWFHYFANVDYRRRLALVAEHESSEGLELIGVGRYEPTVDDAVAEVAFVVQDGWQGRSVGTMLLQHVLDAAEARGIRRFRAYVLADNHRMLGLIAACSDIEERKTEDGVADVVFSRRARAQG